MRENLNIFEQQSESKPLPETVRPGSMGQFVGQKDLIQKLHNFKELPHIILWGPPGSGKTTLALILSKHFHMELYRFNAVLSGVPELRKMIENLLEDRKVFHKKAILFIDEIHRFNKSQQDALLPHLERGDFVLIGATTEYPQTSLNRALLSRVTTFELSAHTKEDLLSILSNALLDIGKDVDASLLKLIVTYSNGDARVALNHLEKILQSKKKPDLNEAKELIGKNSQSYDKNENRHYDVISAFIKSVRGSDPDAAILWLAVMIEGGEEPEFIARRLMILASEDIGNADPQGLTVATNAHYAVKNIGMPEAALILAQATVYLAHAPKSNASYNAINKARAFVKENPTVQVPNHLSSTKPEYQNYKYPHDFPHHWVKQAYSPLSEKFYHSDGEGYEKIMNEFLKKIRQ